MDFDIIKDVMEVVNGIKSGSVVAVGGALTLLIRVYRMFPKLPWPKKELSWVVVVTTFLVGFAASLLTGVFGFDMSWGSSVLAALGVAVNASGLHSVTKAVGQSIPANSPSLFRKAASILLPMPKSKD